MLIFGNLQNMMEANDTKAMPEETTAPASTIRGGEISPKNLKRGNTDRCINIGLLRPNRQNLDHFKGTILEVGETIGMKTWSQKDNFPGMNIEFIADGKFYITTPQHSNESLEDFGGLLNKKVFSP